MRLTIVTVALTTLLVLEGGPAQAAEGDLWTVDRQNVNVRSGPSTSTDILMTINPGDQIVEIAAKDEWLFAEFPARGLRGWVFTPLLITGTAGGTVADTAVAAAPAPAPAPAPVPVVETPVIVTEETAAIGSNTVEAAVAPARQTAAISIDDEPAAVKTFRETVAELNDRAVSVAGINLFSDVRSTGGGGVQVLATETWASVPEAGQSSYMNALFDRWQSMANGLGPLSLQIIDPTGQIMMERPGS